MAIREQGYRHWEGTYTGHALRWWTITKAALRTSVYTRGRLLTLLLLIMLSWSLPFFFGLFYFFGFIEGRLGDPDATLRENLYQMLLNWQWMWGFLFSAVVGSRLVANDLRSDALYIYLAKPLKRIDYIVGKLLACLLWMLPVTIAPAIYVFLSANGSSNKLLHLDEPTEIFFEILIVYGLFMLVCATGAVTISSFTKRWWLALVGWAGAAFLLSPVAQITAAASRNDEWLYLSPRDNLMIFARDVWEQESVPPDPGPAALILVGLVVAFFVVFLVRIARLEVKE